MAHIAGKNGTVTIGGNPITGMKSWTLDYVADMLETTDFADAGVKTYIVGASGWSGTFEALKDGAPQGLAGAAITLLLEESATTSQEWTGSAYITGVHAATSADGIVGYTYDFLGNGALTAASA